jgi:DNA-binding NarL/FixJ family response regulator
MEPTHLAQPIGNSAETGGNHLKPPNLSTLLGARDRQLVRLLVEGCSTEEIANRLAIRPQTVKNRLSRIFAKLGVSTRVQLAVYAVRNGLDDPD